MNTIPPCPPSLPLQATCHWNDQPYRLTEAQLGAFVDERAPALVWDFDIQAERIDPDDTLLDEDALPPDSLHLRIHDCPAFHSGPGEVMRWSDIAGKRIELTQKDEPEVLVYTGEHLGLTDGAFELREIDGRLWIHLHGHCDGMHGPAHIVLDAPLDFTSIACGRRTEEQACELIARVVDPARYTFECDRYGVARFTPISGE
ncbi:hypothetical protein [Stenotrophomonas sp. SY1]|uniref:hypothetical protein n=1 Tax=Stenotrophomonas sp. SY1 TaxID=477235 RepID=UPI001E3A49D0|nr:hypothetical protein [Stenotrophomonas sp. SY1]MCD9088648.1 hypothetical protein [Stenotrophomonas sp. SY1]